MTKAKVKVLERELVERLDAGYEVADKYLADIMGYATPDHRKWKVTKDLTQDEMKRQNQERQLWRNGKISKWEYDRFKKELYERAEANYDALHPRRPKHWPDVVRQSLSLDSEALKSLTRENLEDLIEYLDPEAVKARRKEAKRQEKRKKEAKRIRNLPENKNQKYPWKEKRNWAPTDEPGGIIRRARSSIRNISFWKLLFPSTFKDDKLEPDTPAILRAQSSLGDPANDNEVINNHEFASGYDFGSIPTPGKKPSGRTRKRLGMK